MTAEVIYLHAPRLSADVRVRKIEKLAHDPDVTDAAKMHALRKICHPSLTGLRLWLAWLAAEDAILIRDWTKPDNVDHEGDCDKAEAAISILLHGPRPGDAA